MKERKRRKERKEEPLRPLPCIVKIKKKKLDPSPSFITLLSSMKKKKGERTSRSRFVKRKLQ